MRCGIPLQVLLVLLLLVLLLLLLPLLLLVVCVLGLECAGVQSTRRVLTVLHNVASVGVAVCTLWCRQHAACDCRPNRQPHCHPHIARERTLDCTTLRLAVERGKAG